MIGFPKAKIYAKSNPAGVNEGPTDTDFFVRIVDVYPTGEEYFVVEGCVNARGKEYARSIVNGQENDNAVFENINIGQIYEYEFQMLPIAYTFGKGHRMKVLISSSNYTRYQVNPNLPIMPGEFFRRKPGDGQTYVFEGVEMQPRVAINRVAFAPEYPTQIILPILNQNIAGTENSNLSLESEKEMIVYPNPTAESATIAVSNFGNYTVKISDISGKQIHSHDFTGNETQINTISYAAGIYIVAVEDLLTRKQFTQRLVKR